MRAEIDDQAHVTVPVVLRLAVTETCGDVARQHLSLPGRVLRRGRCDLAWLRQVRHRSGIARREDVGMTGNLQVGLHFEPAALGR
jgi:ubiquinone biosynthesis protein UbiJ